MVRILGFLVLLVWVWSLAESLITPRSEVRLFPKPVWVVLVLALGPIGAGGWLFLGRPRRQLEPTPHHPRPPQQGAGPPAGPDDDPDFLRGL